MGKAKLTRYYARGGKKAADMWPHRSGDWVHHAEAAAALADAQAEIARLEDQVGDWIVRADEANARADRMEALIAQEAEFLAVVQAKKDEYMMALASIRDNTCCEGCQEAARVARAALSPREGDAKTLDTP